MNGPKIIIPNKQINNVNKCRNEQRNAHEQQNLHGVRTSPETTEPKDSTRACGQMARMTSVMREMTSRRMASSAGVGEAHAAR